MLLSLRLSTPVYVPSQFMFRLPFSREEEIRRGRGRGKKEARKKISFRFLPFHVIAEIFSSRFFFLHENYGYLHSINITLVVVDSLVIFASAKAENSA
jgi:hypothetical protein